MPVPCPGTAAPGLAANQVLRGAGEAARRRSVQHAHHLIGGERENREHHVTEYLAMAADADVAAAEIVLEPAVDALDILALVVAQLLRQHMASVSPRLGLAFQILLLVIVARVDVDDRDMPQKPAVPANLRRVIG